MVLTSYNAQVSLIWSVLRRFLADLFMRVAGNHFVFEMTSTVAISHRKENWLLLCTTGRGPDHIGKVWDTTLIENPPDFYILFTRTRQHIVYITSIDFIRSISWSWNTMLNERRQLQSYLG